MTDHIRNLKLITGEEIIAFVDYPGVDTGEDYLTITEPVQIVLQQRADGKLGVSMVPYAVGVDGSITIDKRHIVYDETPKADLQERFRELNSPIEVAPKPGLVLAQ